MIERSIALFGTPQSQPKRITLTAGPLSATLENGALRWIRLGDIEVLRAIAFLVRDRHWDTPEPQLANLVVDQRPDSFRVTFDAYCRTKDGELPWSAEISGDADGTLRFTGTARPRQDFLTNRTGFVILHPLAGVAGCPVEITHTDGVKRQARFPEFIDPEQCFLAIRSLSHAVMPGIRATCTMAGDTWEMEDHRNWLDASFKTYVRPLALPFPYVIPGGSEVTQTVTLCFSGPPPKPAASSKKRGNVPVEVSFTASDAYMPAIGLRAPLQWLDEASTVADLAGEVGAQMLNARLDSRAGHGIAELKRFGALAESTGARLTLELVVPCRRDPLAELEDYAEMLRQSRVQPESIAVFVAEDRLRLEPGPPPPSLALLGEVYRAARAAFPRMAIGGGTFGFFAELNRNWPPAGLIDYITHITCSVVHAADDRTMMENLDSFRAMARTIRAFAGAKPYRLIAAGLGLDSGPYGEPSPNPDNTRRTMVRMDPRHRGLFAAAWTLAAIAEAAHGGLAAISPAALVGELGIIHRRLPYPQPWFDTHDRPALYPLYHVLRGMAHAAGRPSMETFPSDPTRIRAVAYRDSRGRTISWLANVSEEVQRVLLPGKASTLHNLDESSFEAAAIDPAFFATQGTSSSGREIEIGAYGIARMEIGE